MMDQFDEYLRKRAAEEPVPIPEEYHGKVFEVCAGLEEEPKKKKRHWPGWIAAALAILIILPNVSPAAAAAMADIPVLGAIVEILTIRHYTYDDGHSSAEVEVPELGGSKAAEQVSQDVEAYQDQLLAQFEADCAEIGEGYQALDVSSQIVVDSPTWFTLRIDTVETRASGYNYSRFYHIDKRSGETVTLGTLLGTDTGWSDALVEEVHRQMAEAPETDYFPDALQTVEADQNFYWDEAGNLVLVFDEYAVAAGYVGMPEFAIAPEIYEPFLKNP